MYVSPTDADRYALETYAEKGRKGKFKMGNAWICRRSCLLCTHGTSLLWCNLMTELIFTVTSISFSCASCTFYQSTFRHLLRRNKMKFGFTPETAEILEWTTCDVRICSCRRHLLDDWANTSWSVLTSDILSIFCGILISAIALNVLKLSNKK
jgi:hypothetical protein